MGLPSEYTRPIDPYCFLALLLVITWASFWIVAVMPEMTILGFPDGISIPTFRKPYLAARGAVDYFVSPVEEINGLYHHV